MIGMDKKTDAGKKYLRRGILVAAIVMAVVYVFAMMSMHLVQKRIIDFAVKNMEVISEHDAYAIERSVYRYEMLLEGIAQEVELAGALNDVRYMELLCKKKQLMGESCYSLALVSEDGMLLNSTMLMLEDEKMQNLCNTSEEKFVCHYYDEQSSIMQEREIFLIGDRIGPISVKGHTYHYLIARIDVDALQNELKLDSYNAEGHSHVIDPEGHYIINEHRNDTAYGVSNFYEKMENGVLESHMTTEKIRKKIHAGENFTYEYGITEDAVNVINCIYMEFGDWYYVNVVPKEVFLEQSRSLMRLFMFFMFLILAVLIFVGISIFIRRSKMLALERLYQRELREAFDMAEAANHAKTAFLNNMSHDIRTPMNAIIGFVMLAITHIDNKKRVLDYLEKISKSSNHLLSLINDVLNMSRIESGKVNIERNPENLAEILHELKDIILADVHAKQLELYIDALDVKDENIICDRLRLKQVLLNLISNALKYTNPGGMVSIRITEKGYSESGEGVYEFRIKDNGIGMSPEFVKTIFEPFTREKSSTVSGIQGTGLGMAITKNIVDMMNGTIEVISEPGVGTEFVVVFSFPIQEGNSEPLTIRSLEGVHGLIVDDDMHTCQSAASMLRQIGMRPEWCMHGKEAIARTEEAMQIGDCFGVYIIDWLMPEMNGIETARRIRKIVDSKTPIILLSAYDWTDLEEEAREAGITDFISKPLFLSELHRKLMMICGEEVADSTEEENEEISFAGKRLLLAEDIEMNREIAVEILSQAGFMVETAENGKVALEKVENSEPGYFDAVLMDVQMPVMNGYEATREIRNLEDEMLSSIPIIAMTANAFDEDKEEALKAGMNAHVSKPIDIPALWKALETALF